MDFCLLELCLLSRSCKNMHLLGGLYPLSNLTSAGAAYVPVAPAVAVTTQLCGCLCLSPPPAETRGMSIPRQLHTPCSGSCPILKCPFQCLYTEWRLNLLHRNAFLCLLGSKKHRFQEIQSNTYWLLLDIEGHFSWGCSYFFSFPPFCFHGASQFVSLLSDIGTSDISDITKRVIEKHC